MNNYNALEKKILSIAKYDYNYFLNKYNVVGIGLGYKIKNGFITNQKCLRVFVSKKIPTCKLFFNDLIPNLFKGIPTDVIESGRFSFQSLTKKVRPATGGYSIGPALHDSGGTLGCIVTDGKYYYVLSNNHTLTSNETIPLNFSITQPSALYGGHMPDDVIATLSNFIPTKYKDQGEVNYADCAVAKITQRSKISTKITFLGRIKGMTTPVLNLPIQKVGATTELTTGTITAIGATVEFCDLMGKSIYLNQIITNKMSELGDSGAILLDKNMYAIGMLMSGSISTSTFNPIEAVLSSLHVKLVTG